MQKCGTYNTILLSPWGNSFGSNKNVTNIMTSQYDKHNDITATYNNKKGKTSPKSVRQYIKTALTT